MEESHFLDMMRAVQPHVSGRPKRSVELMLQSADLLHSVRQYQEPELSACDTSQDFIDFEAMLTDLQPVCNPAEAELVNLILNFFRSRKIYTAYKAASRQTAEAQAQQNHLQAAAMPDAPAENRQEANFQNGSYAGLRNLMENQAFQSLLSPAQKENLNQIGTLIQTL